MELETDTLTLREVGEMFMKKRRLELQKKCKLMNNNKDFSKYGKNPFFLTAGQIRTRKIIYSKLLSYH